MKSSKSTDQGFYGAKQSPSKRRSEVTMEDLAHIDTLSITADDPLTLTAAKYVNSVFDLASFTPLKPLSHKATPKPQRSSRKPRGRRLPFSTRPSLSSLPLGVPTFLQHHTTHELELDYYQSLLDEAGHFRKFVPVMDCCTEVLMVEFRLLVVEGRIWRNFRMEAGTSFYSLRRAILDLMCWSEETSWTFIYISRDNQLCMLGQTGPLKSEEELRSEEQQLIIETLHESYCKFTFIYDLQRRWKVDLVLRKVLDREEGQVLPVCVKGRGSLELGRVPSLQRLRKVVEVLRLQEHPKRGKYQDKYGDLLAPVHVISTAFPSFYTQPIAASPEKRHRRKRGPFSIKWTCFPRSPSPPPSPPASPPAPVFSVSFTPFPVPQPYEDEPTDDKSQASELDLEIKPVVHRRHKASLLMPSDLPSKRQRKPADRYEPPVRTKRHRRERGDGVLVINYPPP